GVTIPDEDWALFRGSSEESFYRRARDRYKVPVPLEELRAEGRQEVLEVFSHSLKFMDGFETLHDQICPDYKLGLVTSTPALIFNMMDKRLNLRNLFPLVLTGEMTVHNKPHPEPYLTMMAKLQVDPEESVVIEDSIPGIQAAWDSGAWTVALTGSVPVEAMPERHLTISHLSQLDAGLISALPDRLATAAE
ncbi:MAG: HAD-IA family hydrolase, partial [Candidatus Marinimicrobia bacterium]|nr:HAD-IA family hydrolase [Candidatus Neomarinimicrobiota bacterium]